MQVQVVILPGPRDPDRGGQPSPQREKGVAVTCAARSKNGVPCLVSHFGTFFPAMPGGMQDLSFPSCAPCRGSVEPS